MILRLLAIAAVSFASAAACGTDPRKRLGLAESSERQLPALTETYKHLHRNPELSHHEEQTSAYLAAELRKLGYTVTEHVGKYPDGSQAFGVVAVLAERRWPSRFAAH